MKLQRDAAAPLAPGLVPYPRSSITTSMIPANAP